MGTWCTSLLRPGTGDCVPSKGFSASALAPGPSVHGPVPKPQRRAQAQGINGWLLSQGAEGVPRSFPGSHVRGKEWGMKDREPLK